MVGGWSECWVKGSLSGGSAEAVALPVVMGCDAWREDGVGVGGDSWRC